MQLSVSKPKWSSDAAVSSHEPKMESRHHGPSEALCSFRLPSQLQHEGCCGPSIIEATSLTPLTICFPDEPST